MDIKDILEEIALPARSKRTGFYNTEKLEAIQKLLEREESPFHLILQNEHTWIFGKQEPKKMRFSILVSSHADIVDGITKPFSTYSEEKQAFHGTYDNLGTNAACVALMLDPDTPDNVYFAFNDEEETGRCLGAEEALKYVTQTSFREPFCIALDVTDEGYDHNRLFTIEGMHSKNAATRERVLKQLLTGEGEQQSFEVVRMDRDDNVSMLPESYVAKGLTVFDESVFYADKNCNSFSFDLPTTGSMHSDSGLWVKEPVMRGYVKSLLQTICILDGQKQDRVQEIKKEKEELISQAKEIKDPYAPQYHPFHSGSYYHNFDEDYMDDEGGLPWHYGSSYADYDDDYAFGNELEYSHTGHPDPVTDDIIWHWLLDEAANYERDEFDQFAEAVRDNYLDYLDDEEADIVARASFECVHVGIFGGAYYSEEDAEQETANHETGKYATLGEFYQDLVEVASAYTKKEFEYFYSDACEFYGLDIPYSIAAQAFMEGVPNKKKKKDNSKKNKKKQKMDSSLKEEPEESEPSYYEQSYHYNDELYERDDPDLEEYDSGL